MICQPCAAAADARAPRDQHCHNPKCTCGHRTDRYRPAAGFDAITAMYDDLDRITKPAEVHPRATVRPAGEPLPPMIRYLAEGEDPDDEPTVVPARILAVFEQQATAMDAHADAVETAITRVEADHGPDDIIHIPRTTTEH